MIVKTEKDITFEEDVQKVRFEHHEDNETIVVIRQGGDTIWVPREDAAEFARAFAAWAAENG